ncbi:MAG: HD domain-containing protein, partial [Thermoplasmataceae archaeon]
FCYLVFPGANHTRFEHSLGTMKLAGEYGEALNSEKMVSLKAAALLHDIGHGPFSHSFEGVLDGEDVLGHEEIGIRLLTGRKPFQDSTLPGVLEDSGFEISEIANLIKNDVETLEGTIISGQLDADEMDYLRRDNYYTGMGSIPFDYRRVINISRTDGKKIFIEEKGIPTIESILLNRFLMYKSVYFHKTSRIAQLMMSKAIQLYTGDITELSMMDDGEFLWNMKNDHGSAAITDLVLKRNLMVPAISLEYDDEIEKSIRDKLYASGFSEDDFILDVIPPKSFVKKRFKTGAMVSSLTGMKEAENFSPLLSALSQSFSMRKITVFSFKVHRDKILALLRP